MNILDMKHIKKSFDGKIVLQDIDLQISPGEVVSILGPSGSGKSTLLRCATFLETIDSGEIAYNGKSVVTTEGDHAIYPKRSDILEAQSNFGLVFQNFNLFPHFSVLKNVYHAPLKVQKRTDKDEVISEAYDLLTKVGLSDKSDAYPCELSGGQQQRVAIARAIVNEPEILLLDEPLGALDYKMRKEMQFELKEMHKELGITFIFVTHDQEEALSMSDTIVVLNDGVIQQIGTPMDIYNEPQNRFVAEFIGESNIIEGNMIKDCLVNFDGIDWECVDKGFKDNEDIEVVLRPEDMDVVEPEAGKVSGTIISKVFMGVHYEYLVETKNRNYKVHTTENYEIGKKVGLTIDPFDIQVMHKMEN